MLKQKFAELNVSQNWVEFLCIVLLVIGLFLAINAQNAFVVYIVIFLSGIISGRIVFALKKKKQGMFLYFIVTVFFVFGYIIGMQLSISGSKFFVILLFIVSNMLSLYLHEKFF